MNDQQKTLAATFRQVLAEHENGALGGIDLAVALAQAVLAANWTPKLHVAGISTGWEYGLLNPQAPGGGQLQGKAYLISDSRSHVLDQKRHGHPVIQAIQRRKAGKWEPVGVRPNDRGRHPHSDPRKTSWGDIVLEFTVQDVNPPKLLEGKQ